MSPLCSGTAGTAARGTAGQWPESGERTNGGCPESSAGARRGERKRERGETVGQARRHSRALLPFVGLRAHTRPPGNRMANASAFLVTYFGGGPISIIPRIYYLFDASPFPPLTTEPSSRLGSGLRVGTRPETLCQSKMQSAARWQPIGQRISIHAHLHGNRSRVLVIHTLSELLYRLESFMTSGFCIRTS